MLAWTVAGLQIDQPLIVQPTLSRRRPTILVLATLDFQLALLGSWILQKGFHTAD